MNSDVVISFMKVAMLNGTLVMAPILLAGLLVGVLVGALQGATQINEPTMTFVPKVVAVGLVAAFILPWALDRFVMLFRTAIVMIAATGPA